MGSNKALGSNIVQIVADNGRRCSIVDGKCFSINGQCGNFFGINDFSKKLFVFFFRNWFKNIEPFIFSIPFRNFFSCFGIKTVSFIYISFSQNIFCIC